MGSVGRSVIDHVWVSYDILEILGSFEVVHIPSCSDHFPIRISLSRHLGENLKETQGTSYRSLKWDNRLKDEFQEFLVGRVPGEGDVEELYDSMTKLIYEFATCFKLFKNKRIFTTRKPWIDVEVRKKKETFKLALSNCKAAKFLDEGLTQTFRLARSDLA